tara:strand:+ start:88 stop:297 length:210 start_codon:yes stop_codon:yes gene_type:complete
MSTNLAKDGFVRSLNNPGAVVNVDNSALSAYKSRKQKNRDYEQKIKEIDALKIEMSEIKSLLQQIVEKI